MYQTGKNYWEVETIVKRISRMIHLVKGPKMVHKRHWNQTKNGHMDEENDTPVDVEPMEVLFDTFETKIPKRQRGKEEIQTESTLTQKGKDIGSVQSKSKKVGVIYCSYEH